MMKLMFKEAAADCDEAIALDDSNAKAFFRKGKALLAGGQPQAAVAAFTAGLVKDPSNAEAKSDRKTAEEVSQRLALAKQCLAKKEYVQVWKQLQIVEKHIVGGGGVDVLMMKVEALCCIGKHSEAYALTTQLMRSHPSREGLLFWRAKCLYYMDQVTEGLSVLRS
jgi:tetratricopeptide (TPR) repeat protein